MHHFRMHAWVGFGNLGVVPSHKLSSRSPSKRGPAPKEMISDSVELCDTELCILHIQLMVLAEHLFSALF